MLVWGDNSIGSYHDLGRDILLPTKLPKGDAILENMKVLAIGEHQCCVLDEDGSVTVFENPISAANDTSGSLSQEIATSLKVVPTLQPLKIVDVFAGGNHMFAVADDGRAYGWGENNHGQLGWKDDSEIYVSIPRNISLPSDKQVVQISCGISHTLVLLNDGSVYSMGDNSYGQLGIDTYEPTSEPSEVSCLTGLPVAQIVACGWHSFCVTVSGTVFCWGRNDFGQLGLGDQSNRNVPCPLHMPGSLAVKLVAGGHYHTAVLSHDGQLFTFGSSSKGQLGNGRVLEPVVVPERVSELIGSVVTQIACGKMHTMAYVPDSANIFVWGDGKKGQLGQNRKLEYLDVPTIVDGLWKSSNSSYKIIQISACGNQSLAITGDSLRGFEIPVLRRQPWTIDTSRCHQASQMSKSRQITATFTQWLDCTMRSQSCVNSSFLAKNHHTTGEEYHGLNLKQARKFFSMLMEQKNEQLLQIIETHWSQVLLPSLLPNPHSIETLRIYLLLPECEIFRIPEYHDSLSLPFVEKLLNLAERPCYILEQWYRTLDSDLFVSPVRMCQECIVSTLKRDLQPDLKLEKIGVLLKFMEKLYRVNNSASIVDFRKFYIPQLNNLLPLPWALNINREYCFSQYPFVYDLKAKVRLLKIDADIQRSEAFLSTFQQNGLALLSGRENTEQNQVFVIKIRRERLVEDTISELRKARNLKRPLYVEFIGEEGQDYGGVQKEFFMLLMREILDAKRGMFRQFEDSNLLWFNDNCPATDDMYHLVGTLCGLAVYHDTIVDINFPLALYKKILGMETILSDLLELDPILGSSLQQLSNFEEDENSTVEDIFGLHFTISKSEELIENGESIPVTAENRDEYLHAYVKHIFDNSVRSQFECFKNGFLKVCGGRLLDFFRPEELREMVIGNQDYDWQELEKVTVYADGYFKKNKVIVWFWQVFRALTAEDKKEFVRFLTGTCKIPITGLQLVIKPKMKDGIENINDYLPVAHTCFNVLDLPQYTRKEALESKLKLAIKTDGFYVA